MGLTKKHFKAIAQIMKKNKPSEKQFKGSYAFMLFNWIINDLSDYFKTENALFDAEKFKNACLGTAE